MRPDELLALQWNEVDLEAGVVHVHATLVRIKGRGLVREAPEASSRRSVPLPAITVTQLRRHRNEQRPAHLAAGVGWAQDDYAFTSRRGALLDPSNLTAHSSRAAPPTGEQPGGLQPSHGDVVDGGGVACGNEVMVNEMAAAAAALERPPWSVNSWPLTSPPPLSPSPLGPPTPL